MAPTAAKMRGTLRYDPTSGLFYKNGIQVGHIRKDGYVLISGGWGVLYLGHRLAWKIMYGRWPTEIDHIDGNPSNNSIKNLREVLSYENKSNSKRNREGRLPKRRRSSERDWRKSISYRSRGI